MSDKDADKILDYTVTEQEKEIAQSALVELNKNNLTGCLQHLAKLEHRTNDFKLCMNRAVVEYLKSDLKKTEVFKKHLNNVFLIGNMKSSLLDDVEQCVAHFNRAVLLYHSKQYEEALKATERIYKFIEPMEEYLAYKVCLLLIELHLCMRQPKKALNLISYVENQILHQDDSGKKLGKNNPEPTDKKAAERFRKKLIIYKIRCLIMCHDLAGSKQLLESVQASKHTSVALACLRANVEYLLGDAKKSMQILTTLTTNTGHLDSDCKEILPISYYNNMGILHLKMGKPNMAAFYLHQALKENQQLAGKIKNDSDSNLSLHLLGASKYHEIVHNLGVAMLLSGQPGPAFDFLVMAVQRYHRNVRLWLRLAECCIQLHKPSNEYDFDLAKRQKDIVLAIHGSGKHRKAVIGTTLSRDAKYSTEAQSYAVPMPTVEFASLCLRNARLLLRLPDASPASPAASPLLLLPGSAPKEPTVAPGCAPSPPLPAHEQQALRSAVFAASAYVDLCLGDYVMGLEHARALLDQDSLAGTHKLLGNLYAAQALILMNRVGEACKHLHFDNFKDLCLDMNGEEREDEGRAATRVDTRPNTKWFPNDPSVAQALMQYNMAVALCLKGDYDKAAKLLNGLQKMRKSSGLKVPVQSVLLSLYVDLQLGRSNVVRNFIEKYAVPKTIAG